MGICKSLVCLVEQMEMGPVTWLLSVNAIEIEEKTKDMSY